MLMARCEVHSHIPLWDHALTSLHQASQTLFKGKYTAQAINGQYICAYVTFIFILVFEEFTGGGGNGDESPDDEDAEKDNFEWQITLAHQQGCLVGNLSLKVHKKWQVWSFRCTVGIYHLKSDLELIVALMHSLGKSSKVICDVVRNFAAQLSNVKSIPSDRSEEHTSELQSP